LVCHGFPTASLNIRVPFFDVSWVISVLSAGALVESPQLLQSFDIAVFRRRSQQHPRLLAIPRDAVAREVKLCKRDLCRTITCS
jgi:hypothetical protein